MIRVLGSEVLDEAPPQQPGPPFMSPTGTHVLAFDGYEERQPGLVTYQRASVERSDGTPLVDFSGPFLEPHPYRPWSPDGRRIVLAPWSNRIEVVDIVSDTRWVLTGVPLCLQWAPAIDRILISNTHEARLIDPREQTTVARVERPGSIVEASWWANRWLIVQRSVVEVFAGATGEPFGALDLDPLSIEPIDDGLLGIIREERLGIWDRPEPRYADPDRWLTDLMIRPIDERHLGVGVLRPTSDETREDEFGRYLPGSRIWVSITTT